ncbi:MAG: type I DNA topoisomerase [Malacoplasma sp.]|nr:type I DNA topoisomerase [Malacoplasma sp.]
MDKLLIIESPNKIKTLNKYLGKDYEIVATIGHIRDLSSFGMGFDKDTFEPKWIIPNPKGKIKNERPKKEIIKEIKKLASKAKEIYLATDPDREGEAIAWHVYEILDKENKAKCKRITFNEITKNAIIDSFDHKRDIDLNWVQSQFARRIIDRMIGFKLSKLLQIKLKAESAGRVQSVALKFIEDREKEIKNFIVEKWWTIDSVLEDGSELILKSVNPELKNIEICEKNFSTGINFNNEKSAEIVLKSLLDYCTVKEIEEPSYYSTSPKAVYKTSTLQQDAINKLNWSSKKTTLVAQRLYEGIEIDGNQIALISYPRTDSVRLSDSFLSSCFDFIEKNFGKEYLGKYQQKTSKNQANVQDAHEGIRPIDPFLKPEDLVGKIDKDDLALYRLIWIRTVASLMSSAKFKRVNIRFESASNEFYTFSRECEFDGYRKIYSHFEDKEENKLINLSNYKVGNKINFKSKKSVSHETTPPPRYTQATLIADLEKAGVGRPSTYSSMANVAIDRGYANLEKKSFIMTDMGKTVIFELEKFFPNIINKNFTKEMEEHLDKIATGGEEWKKWIKDFSPSFYQEVDKAYETMEKVEDEKVGKDCPNCSKPLVYKHARKGGSKFIGCSGYPDCKYLESINKPEILNDKCPECSHNLLMRKSKKGLNFVGCSNWPKCDYIMSDKLYNQFKSENPEKALPKKIEIEELKKNINFKRFSKKKS